jgi:hypothetical protein
MNRLRVNQGGDGPLSLARNRAGHFFVRCWLRNRCYEPRTALVCSFDWADREDPRSSGDAVVSDSGRRSTSGALSDSD